MTTAIVSARYNNRILGFAYCVMLTFESIYAHVRITQFMLCTDLPASYLYWYCYWLYFVLNLYTFLHVLLCSALWPCDGVHLSSVCYYHFYHIVHSNSKIRKILFYCKPEDSYRKILFYLIYYESCYHVSKKQEK